MWHTNQILNLPDRTLVTTPIQPNKTNTLLYNPEQSFKSDITQTRSSGIDGATLLTCESNETSDGFFSQKINANKNYYNCSKNNTEDKYLKNEQDLKSDTKSLNQLISSIRNVNAHITVNNYKTFLNFDYQNTKDKTPELGAKYGDKMNFIKSIFKPTSVELTSHNNNNNKIMNWTSKICKQSVETDNEGTIYTVNTLHKT
ncbi:paramyosin (Allergen Blo t 11) [Schistosoma japonicum]|nr:paramyosin (Allergen Blo t 11) [Schistosoma japonicum]